MSLGSITHATHLRRYEAATVSSVKNSFAKTSGSPRPGAEEKESEIEVVVAGVYKTRSTFSQADTWTHLGTAHEAERLFCCCCVCVCVVV